MNTDGNGSATIGVWTKFIMAALCTHALAAFGSKKMPGFCFDGISGENNLEIDVNRFFYLRNQQKYLCEFDRSVM
jgi:hypothetical protein